VSEVQQQLTRIVRLIVDEPDAVEISEIPQGRQTLLELRVAEEDLGKVIGRQGRTALAFRSLLATRGARDGLRYDLQIID